MVVQTVGPNEQESDFVLLISTPSTFIFEKVVKTLDTESIWSLGSTCRIMMDMVNEICKERFKNEINMAYNKTRDTKPEKRAGFGSPKVTEKLNGRPLTGWRLGQSRFSRNWMYWRKFRERIRPSINGQIRYNVGIKWFRRLEYDVRKQKSAVLKREKKSTSHQLCKGKQQVTNDHRVYWSKGEIIVEELAKADKQKDRFWNILGEDYNRFRPLDAVKIGNWILMKTHIIGSGTIYPELIMVNLYSQARSKFQSDNLDLMTKAAIRHKSCLTTMNVQLETCEMINWNFEQKPVEKTFGKRMPPKGMTEKLNTVTIRSSYQFGDQGSPITFNTSCEWEIQEENDEASPVMKLVKSKINWILLRQNRDRN